jgi:hypothetical protein
MKGYYYARLAQSELEKIEKVEKEINEVGDKPIFLLAFSKENQ